MNHWAYVGLSKNLENTKKVLDNIEDIKQTLDLFLKKVCKLPKKDIDQIFNNPRGKEEIVMMRYFVMRYLNHLDSNRYSKSALGRMFKKDHSSIIHAINRTETVLSLGAQSNAEKRGVKVYQAFNANFLQFIKLSNLN